MGKTIDGGLGSGIGAASQTSIFQTDFNAHVSKLFSKEPKPFDSSKFSYADSESKYDGYLLKNDHKDGGSKAKFFNQVLGYKKGDGKALHNAVSEAINGKLPNVVKKTDFGTKYNFNVKIKGKDGNYHSANVTVVVQNDHGKTTWRLITIIPGKKD